jgi:hypothetical protein
MDIDIEITGLEVGVLDVGALGASGTRHSLIAGLAFDVTLTVRTA